MPTTPLPSALRWVGQADALEALAHELMDAPRVVMDTEFHAERRYTPELMLLQLGLPDGSVALVDARVLDLRPLAPALEGRPWVVHGGSQDLLILNEVLGVRPTEVHDTQVLAGLSGHGYPRGMGRLAKAVLGEELDKGGALSDWARRPLAPDQLHYAALDVIITRRLWDRLAELRPDRVDWAVAFGTEMLAEATEAQDPGAAIVRWTMAADLSETQRRALAFLYRWRDRRARERAQPAGYILNDGMALDLARRMPGSLADMRANRRMPSGLIKSYGDELLSVLQQARGSTEEPPAVLDRGQQAQLERDRMWGKAIEVQTGLAQELILPARVARGLASGTQTMTGWRQEACGELFSAWRSGSSAINSDGKMVAID